jgi:SAM-dependent methyltransferase
MTWLILLLALTAVVALGYYLLVATEGVFLGKRVVIWLYDLTAHKYDDIKGFDPLDERFSVARPIVNGLANPSGKVLDVATGTGRVPVALASDPAFHGLVVGLDPSRKMLDQAARKLAGRHGRVSLIRHPAVPLPFADAVFDAVTCLEALEFLPSAEAALAEMVRVLRPGGFLMTTRRRSWEGRAFLGRYRPAGDFEDLLRGLGLDAVRSHLWQMSYDRVTARKPIERRFG